MEKKPDSEEIPYVRISRAILWAIDKIHKTRKTGREFEWILVSDIIEKSDANYQNLKSYIKRSQDKGIDILNSLYDKDTIRAIKIEEKFEKRLRNSFKPFTDEEDNEQE